MKIQMHNGEIIEGVFTIKGRCVYDTDEDGNERLRYAFNRMDHFVVLKE